jgi:hypothetical protein
VIDPETNIEMQVGKLNGLSIGGMDFSGYSFYGKNVYISGTIERLKPNGTPAKDLSYEGVWESGRKYDYYDSVTHDGSTWACMNKNGSSAEPGTNNDWQKIASKGDKGDPGESAVFADLTNQMDNVNAVEGNLRYNKLLTEYSLVRLDDNLPVLVQIDVAAASSDNARNEVLAYLQSLLRGQLVANFQLEGGAVVGGLAEEYFISKGTYYRLYLLSCKAASALSARK